MKKKEIKALAKKMAKAELIIQTSNDEKQIRKAQEEILMLSGSVDSLDDIVAIDEEVQNILSEKNI